MPGLDHPEPTVEIGVFADLEPACVALVPLVAATQWPQIQSFCRSDSTFVAHLIATAEHVPQTRGLRRATPADAQTAYGAQPAPGLDAGVRTRRII
jgi:hypothetical protein